MHEPRGNHGVEATGKQNEDSTADAKRQAAWASDTTAVEVSRVVADFNANLDLRVFQRNTTTLTIPVAPAPTDVQITGFASTGSPAAGTNFHYTFQVKNGGAQPAYGVVFTDAVPAGETLIVVGTDTFAPCTIANGTATCALGDLAVGSQVLINVGVAAPTTAGTLTNTGSANATNGDTQPKNNSVSVVVQVK